MITASMRELFDIAENDAADRFCRAPDDYVSPFAVAMVPTGLAFIEMPDSDTSDQRTTLKRWLPEHEATAVAVVNEVWAASAAPGSEDERLILELKARGRLQDAPPHLLREELQVWVETPDVPCVREAAAIQRGDDGTRSLGPFSPGDGVLHYPRPTFRRYFPEAS